MTDKSRDWTPIRSGNVYCSPACGGGCTVAAYKSASRKAKALAQKLGIDNWSPVVSENLYWFYHVECNSAPISIYPHGRDEFWCTTADSIGLQFCDTGKTPAGALARVIDRLKAAASLLKTINRVEKRLESRRK